MLVYYLAVHLYTSEIGVLVDEHLVTFFHDHNEQSKPLFLLGLSSSLKNNEKPGASKRIKRFAQIEKDEDLSL